MAVTNSSDYPTYRYLDKKTYEKKACRNAKSSLTLRVFSKKPKFHLQTFGEKLSLVFCTLYLLTKHKLSGPQVNE